MIPTNYDKFLYKNKIPREATKETFQRDSLKNTKDKSEWNLNYVQITHRKEGEIKAKTK